MNRSLLFASLLLATATLQAQDPKPAPYLGEHSEEVLAGQLGLASGEIARLIDRGIVATSDKDTK